jgi:hypothetical protein
MKKIVFLCLCLSYSIFANTVKVDNTTEFYLLMLQDTVKPWQNLTPMEVLNARFDINIQNTEYGKDLPSNWIRATGSTQKMYQDSCALHQKGNH